MQKVLDAGAQRAEVIELDATPTEANVPTQLHVEVRYIFAHRAALDRYLADHAPRLRAEGTARFPANLGIEFRRTIGLLVCHLPEGYSAPHRRGID